MNISFSRPRSRGRRILLALGILTIIISALLPTLAHIYRNNNLQTPNQKSVISNSREQKLVDSKKSQPKEVFDSSDINRTMKRSAADVAVVNSWFDVVGYSPEKMDTYRAYSDAVLIDLVKGGDVIAMYVMEEKALNSGNIPEAKSFAELAIVHGSLQSIKSMSTYNQPAFGVVGLEEAKTKYKESLAYLGLLSFRGDPYSARLFKETLAKQFNDAYKVEKPLSAEDEEFVNKRTEELYAQYQAKRQQSGLGDFDNHVPKEVKDFFEEK